MSVDLTVELSESGSQDLPAALDPAGEGLVYGTTLALWVDDLDPLCADAGVRPLSDFIDDSQLMDPDERADAGLPPAVARWAPAAEGLRTVAALLAAIDADHAAAWDLRAIGAILRPAAAAGESFRLVAL